MSGDPQAAGTASGKKTEMTTETILANATLVLPHQTLRGQIRLHDGQIAEIATSVRELTTLAEDMGSFLEQFGTLAHNSEGVRFRSAPKQLNARRYAA